MPLYLLNRGGQTLELHGLILECDRHAVRGTLFGTERARGGFGRSAPAGVRYPSNIHALAADVARAEGGPSGGGGLPSATNRAENRSCRGAHALPSQSLHIRRGSL